MIPQDTVNKILDAARIEEVIGDFMTLRRRGASYLACCPFHNEKTPSFHVTPSKGIFKCFGCGESGTAVGFLMKHENMSYVEALRYIAAKYGIEVKEKEESAEEMAQRQRTESLMLVCEFAQKFYLSNLDTREGQVCARAYYRNRGLSDEIIKEFGLGWAPSSKTALLDAARAEGYKEEYLVEAGLCNRYDDGTIVDKFRSRAMFPIHSVSGRVIAYSGRTLSSEPTIAKYVNSPETPLYIKSRSLFGIALAKKEISKQDSCILVEGNVDVVQMHQLGIRNVVASCGTSLTREQVQLIRRFTSNVTIMYDGDGAGIKAAVKGINLILQEGLNVKVVLLPDGQDPDDFCRRHSLDEVKDFISENSRNFVEFKSALLPEDMQNDPIRRTELIAGIMESIALIPDNLQRAVYVRVCAEKFAMSESLLSERVAGIRKKALMQASQRDARPDDTAGHLAPSEQTTTRDPAQVQTQTQASPCLSRDADKGLDQAERALLYYILKYGRDRLMFDIDSEYKSATDMEVFDFIDSILYEDQTEFANALYKRAYDKYADSYDNKLDQDTIIRTLMDDSDRDVAQLVSDIAVEKYDITLEALNSTMTSRTTLLVKFVPEALLHYQLAHINKENELLLDRLKTLTDGEEMKDLLTRIDNNNKMRNTLCHKLNVSR